MKKVKLIYFPLIVLLSITFIVMGFVHVCSAGNKNGVSDAYLDAVLLKTNTLATARAADKSSDGVSKNVRESVVSYLSALPNTSISRANSYSYDITEDNVDTGENYNLVYYSNEANRTRPVYFTQNERLRNATVEAMATSFDDDTFYSYAGRQVNNVIVLIPGTKTQTAQTTDDLGDAVLFTAHMDPSKKIAAAQDATGLIMVSAMIEEIEGFVKNGYDGENDLVFVFTDGRYDSSVGLYTFLYQFTGFRWYNTADLGYDSETDVANRVKFAVNFDAMGTGDTAMLVGATGAYAIDEYLEMMNKNLSSSFVSNVLNGYHSDFDALKQFGINSLNLVTFGDLKNESTSSDSTAVLSKESLRQLAAQKINMLKASIQHLSDLGFDAEGENGDFGSEMVYFSVLGMFTVAFPKYVSYILGGILGLIMAAAVFFIIRKNAFSLRTMFKGVLLQLLSIGLAMAAMFLVFFISMLILMGFGVIVPQGVVSFTYYSPGLIIGFLLLATAMQGLFYNLLKNVFGIKATDTARGGVSLFVLVSFVLAFAVPSLGAMLWLPAVLASLTMLLTSVFKAKYKEKTGQDIERMLFYLVPLAFLIPIILPTICLLFAVSPLVLAPVMLLPFMLAIGMVCPYLLAIKPLMSKLFQKLPMHTIKVERTVTELVEDRAKKGKFVEVTHKKITKEKIHWHYRHGVFMAVLAIISAVIITISAGARMPVGASVYGFENYGREYYTESIFDDSLVVSYIKSGDNAAAISMEIRDKALYSELRYVLEDFSWDSGRNAYTKTMSGAKLGTPPDINGGTSVVITPAVNGTEVGMSEITLHDASNVTEVVVTLNNGDEITIRNDEKKDNLVIRLPIGEREYSLKIAQQTFKGDIKATYRQYIWYADQPGFLTQNNADYASIAQFAKEKPAQSIRYGIYYEMTLVIPLS